MVNDLFTQIFCLIFRGALNRVDVVYPIGRGWDKQRKYFYNMLLFVMPCLGKILTTNKGGSSL